MQPNKATKLQGLKITSVDLVDRGANGHAHMKFAKSDTAPEPPDAPQAAPQDEKAFFSRMGEFFAKMFRGPGPELVAKEAKTFNEIKDHEEVYERMWKITDAFRESIRSIADDTEIDDATKAVMISTTADQLAAAVKADIAQKFFGKADVATVTKTEPAPTPGAETDNPQPPAVDEPVQKKGDTDMNFDTSKMTPEEKTAFEALAKKYGTEGTSTPAPAAPASAPAAPAAPAAEGADDIYKGLNPAVKTELERLRKFQEEAEARDTLEVAKKYTILGHKPDELAKSLTSLKKAGGTAYADMIAILDQSVATIEQSGVFSEIGKRGGSAVNDAWNKIEAAASEIMKSDAKMSKSDAIDIACKQHPELLTEYEKSRH